MNIPCKDCICLPVCKNKINLCKTCGYFNLYKYASVTKCKLISIVVKITTPDEQWDELKKEMINILGMSKDEK